MNIKSIADLLNEFRKAETDILNKQNIKHPPTIGTMYEGLAANILQQSIFEGLNLKVVNNSFIEGCDTEFDVLLVEGNGKKIPYTKRFIYNSNQVIAIIQVKKNLYSKDIAEGFGNLQFILDYYKLNDLELFHKRLLSSSFRLTCGKDITSHRTENEDYIFHELKTEAILPIRIIWGYNGFKSEFSFRESFINYLQNNLTTDFSNKKNGFGPHNFPNLIICGNYSMIKMNAMPFIAQMKDEWWNFYATSSYNPMVFFLESLWSRLTYKYPQLSMDIFGDDLDMEPASRFLDCHIDKKDDNYGWNYNYFVIKDLHLKQNTEIAKWEPVELDSIQFTVINELCTKLEINLSQDKDLEQFVKSGSYTSLDDFLQRLKLTGLVYIENEKIKLLTDECQCLITSDGKYVAGENKSGRLTNWLMKEMNKTKS